MALTVASLGAACGGGSQDPAAPAARQSPASLIDSSSDTGLKGRPVGVAVGGGSTWVATFDRGGVLSRLDPETGKVSQRIPADEGALGVAYGAGSVWVTNNLAGTVSRVDPKRGKIIATIRVGEHPEGIAFADDTLWITNDRDGTVMSVDPSTNKAGK
ncbi:MAG: virginiamycin lyase, partial [Actinomycetota bacterium]|nr:virginiamycin lyase [Actinomycetota bacterium]